MSQRVSTAIGNDRFLLLYAVFNLDNVLLQRKNTNKISNKFIVHVTVPFLLFSIFCYGKFLFLIGDIFFL